MADLKVYEEFPLRLARQEVDYLNDTIKAALLDSNHTKNLSGHTTWSDVEADEIDDADYAQQTLAGKTIAKSNGNTLIDASNISFGSDVTITAKYLVLYRDTASDKYLIGIADLSPAGGSASSTNSQFAVELTNGVARLVPNPD